MYSEVIEKILYKVLFCTHLFLFSHTSAKKTKPPKIPIAHMYQCMAKALAPEFAVEAGQFAPPTVKYRSMVVAPAAISARPGAAGQVLAVFTIRWKLTTPVGVNLAGIP